MGFKETLFNKVSTVVLEVLKQDLFKMLGPDARQQDIEILNRYFDEGIATASVKSALKKAKIL